MRNKAPLFLVALACLGAWSGTQRVHAASALRVATFSRIVADAVAQVGGNRIEVECLLPADSDPHTFAPRPADLKKVRRADLVVLSGGGLDAAWEKFVPASGFQGRMLPIGQSFASRESDPHWWHSIHGMRAVVQAIGNALAQERPADASFFKESARRYEARLVDLEKWVRGATALVPPSQRIVVTAHDALSSFGKEFGFETHALSGFSDHEEPSSRRVASLIELIREKNIRAVFTEYGESSKLIEAVAKPARAKIAGPLYLDGLGPGKAATYESMMRHNVSAIVEALRER